MFIIQKIKPLHKDVKRLFFGIFQSVWQYHFGTVSVSSRMPFDSICFLMISAFILTIFRTYRSETPNSSARGSSSTPSIKRRFMIFRAFSPLTHSSMSFDNSEFEIPSKLCFMAHPFLVYHNTITSVKDVKGRKMKEDAEKHPLLCYCLLFPACVPK